jgi:eukaryotic-like serine/threonine-protein kinase
MSLAPGSKLGPYEIISSVASGGMGEVYRARDTRLGRIVAIKVLRADLSAKHDLRKRFEREARAVSSLSHPHICGLYDVGHENGVDFLVLELLEGETLADRLRRGALPLDQALRLGVEISTALESAHRRGVVHRDVKPGNIMLTKFGAKILDFGLASLKTGAGHATPTSLSLAPTEALPLTAEAAVVGTVPYLSPEQIEGKEADARSDVFAAGVVLYEALTGRRPFGGPTSAVVMAAILKTAPPSISQLEPGAPRALDHVVERCLAKNPDDRWQSAHDIAIELEWIRDAAIATDTAPPARRPARRERLAWSLAAAAAVIALALATLLARSSRSPVPQAPIRFSLNVPEGTKVAGEPFWSHPSISPDGRQVAFLADSEGTRALWVRRLDAPSAERLRGTEEALAPFWSPDSRSIGFFAGTKLKTIAASGGATRSLCDVPGPAATGEWGRDGTILFAVGEAPGHDGLYRVPESGGAPVRMPIRDEESQQEIGLAVFPSFLPDGKRFLFLDVKSATSGVIYLGSLDTSTARALFRAGGEGQWLDSQAEFALPGYILGVKENTLVVHPFDAASARLVGSPVPLVEGVAQFALAGAFSASQNGALVYLPAGGEGSRLSWFDRSGRAINSVGAPSEYSDVCLSPDGGRAAVGIADPRTGLEDIWIFRFPEGTPTRLTMNPWNHMSPIWSPDGREIVFSASGDGPPHLFRMILSEKEARELVAANGHVQWAEDWSPDGRTVMYVDRDPSKGSDIWTVNVEGDGEPIPLVQTRFNERGAQFSPNGRGIAYVSDESGRPEVYVQPYPGPGEKRRISSAGGMRPRWRRDGREIFYLDPEAEPGLMSVPVDPLTADPLEPPKLLFRVFARVRDYDVSTDGQRFLVNYDQQQAGARIVADVVVNWTAGVRR